MSCRFCTDGSCMICQIGAPSEIGVSGSHGALVEYRMGDELGPGCRRSRAKLSRDDAARGAVAIVTEQPRSKKICPLCGQSFLDLYHHYTKRHPGERAPGA